MTIRHALIWATNFLKKTKISSPALDAEILLDFTLKKSKEFLYAHPEKNLTTTQSRLFKNLVARRAKHEPVAYLTGQKSFSGLDFFVDKNVLIPRPETETLVEEAIKKILNTKYKIPNTSIVDVGTGSGAIAVTLARRLPNTKIFATEISSAALKVARKNARRHKVAVTFLCGNLLQPFLNLKSKILNLKSLVIVANLPYGWKAWKNTSSAETAGLKFEPQIALFTGKNGLELYEKLLKQINLLIANYQLPITSIFEIDPRQTKLITKLIRATFPTAKIEIKKDLAGRDRIVILKIKM